MEHCPICSQPLVPFRAKMVCRTPGCGFMENCCDGGWMSRGVDRNVGPLNEMDVPSVKPSRTSSVSDDCRPS